MICHQVQCKLSAYLDGELTGHEMLEVRAHVTSCPSCARELESLRLMKRMLSSLDAPEPSADFESRLARRVFEAEPSPHERTIPRFALVAVAAAALALAFYAHGLTRAGQTADVAERALDFSVDGDLAFVAGADPLSSGPPIMIVSGDGR